LDVLLEEDDLIEDISIIMDHIFIAGKVVCDGED
jgi:hypothetical protein